MSLEWLKQKTETQHRSLESLMSAYIFDSELSTQSYAVLLATFLKAYQELEGAISNHPLLGLIMQSRSKLVWLSKDLSNLRQLQVAIPSIHLPHTPDYENQAAALGGLYVLEGATMGGNVIQKRLNKISWMTDAYLHFFISYGSLRGEMWRSFLEELREFHEKNPEMQSSIENGSINTFKFMSHTFQMNLSCPNLLT